MLVDCEFFVLFFWLVVRFFLKKSLLHYYTHKRASAKTGQSATSNIFVLHGNMLVQGTENIQNETGFECSFWTRKQSQEVEAVILRIWQ